MCFSGVFALWTIWLEGLVWAGFLVFGFAETAVLLLVCCFVEV